MALSLWLVLAWGIGCEAANDVAGDGTGAAADADADADADGDSDTDDCVVPEDEFEAPPECSESAPPESFEPDVQWTWEGFGGDVHSIVTPLVANLTDDDSAEIVVVSNHDSELPPVQVIRDVEDRWIQARRIWNQHTYHVTNVREDSTIPQHEQPSWELNNTFRTNIQIESCGRCFAAFFKGPR